MEVKIKRTPKSLYKGDRTGLPIPDTERPASAALPGEEGAQVGGDQGTEESSIDSQTEAECPWEGQHPMAVAGLGQQLIDQVGRNVGHATPDAAGAQSAFARECDDPLIATARAAKAGESSTQLAAVQIAAEFTLNEVGITLSVKPGGLIEEGLEVFAHDRVQDALLRFATAVGKRQRGACRTGVALVGDRRQRGFARLRVEPRTRWLKRWFRRRGHARAQ